MWKRLAEFCGGLKMTAVSGSFLLLSLILLAAKRFADLSLSPFLDPAWGTVVISGYPLLYLAVSRLVRQRWISSALLISVAMVAALCIAEVFAAGEVAFIMAVGSILEDKTAERAKKGRNNLIALVPQTARVLIEEGTAVTEREMAVSELRAGMKLRVLAGEILPADGTIVAGSTSVDQSVMTGESLPVDKGEGDEVYCGTLNCYGSVDIVATQVGSDSSLQKLIALLKEAENKKAPLQRIADKWATLLVPIALLIAAAVGIVTYFAVGNEDNAALIRAVTILVVFCPCALALATPTSVMAGIGQAAKNGVLIKSGEAIERMGKANCIAFDKTGTLTLGKPTVSDVVSFGVCSREELLSAAASVELRSEHPLGKAIVKYARKQGVTLAETEKFELSAGKGVCAFLGGRRYDCGSRRFLSEKGIFPTDEQNFVLSKLRSEGKAIILTACEGKILGAIALSDRLRPTAKETVRRLHALGYQTVLLTGDHREAAEYLAAQAGISDVRSELLPEDKVKTIEGLQRQGCRVCMVGDGVNDAPALKAADVGIAMSEIGSDITVEAADIALMDDDIEKLPYLCVLTRSTIRTIKCNIALSMLINVVAILLSSLGLLSPVTGAIVHNAGSALVVLNAALLYDRKFIKKAEDL